MTKVKIISSENYEKNMGGGDTDITSKAINDFIKDKNVVDIKYSANISSSISDLGSDASYLYSAMIIYKEN